MNTQPIIDLCFSCAANIYGRTEPSPHYAEATAKLLAGTAATESFFRYRRQVHFDWHQDGGAWGLWQTEIPPVKDSIKLLQRNAALMDRASAWCYARGAVDLPDLIDAGADRVVRIAMYCDAISVLFARLHYMRVPKPIPESLGDQAVYYKLHYNTVAGKGTPEKYIADFRQYVQPYL